MFIILSQNLIYKYNLLKGKVATDNSVALYLKGSEYIIKHCED